MATCNSALLPSPSDTWRWVQCNLVHSLGRYDCGCHGTDWMDEPLRRSQRSAAWPARRKRAILPRLCVRHKLIECRPVMTSQRNASSDVMGHRFHYNALKSGLLSMLPTKLMCARPPSRLKIIHHLCSLMKCQMHRVKNPYWFLRKKINKIHVRGVL